MMLTTQCHDRSKMHAEHANVLQQLAPVCAARFVKSAGHDDGRTNTAKDGAIAFQEAAA
jgi:hypothetical protein